MISKMILASNELGCSDEIITIAAVLSIQVTPLNPFSSAKFFVSLKLKEHIANFLRFAFSLNFGI